MGNSPYSLGPIRLKETQDGKPLVFHPLALCGLRIRGNVAMSGERQINVGERIIGSGDVDDPQAWAAAFAALGGRSIQLVDEDGQPVPIDEIAL